MEIDIFRKVNRTYRKRHIGFIRTILIVGLVFLMLTGYYRLLPRKLFLQPNSVVLYDKEGNLIGTRVATDGQWRFPEDSVLPEKYKTCLLEYEDRYFYDHLGENPFALFRALLRDVKAGRIISGGSTLTMQVVKIRRNHPRRSLWEKGAELFLAGRLEMGYTKDQILSLYANHAPFGGNVTGITAASWRYFGRPPTHLSWSEQPYWPSCPIHPP